MGQSDEEPLRSAAEAILAEHPIELEPNDPLSIEDYRLQNHELAVHRVELELQNEELRRAQVELELARDRYAELFEQAPVAYFTLGEGSKILEANRAGADLLGCDRNWLVGRRLGHFVKPEDYLILKHHADSVINRNGQLVCQLPMQSLAGRPFLAQLTSLAVRGISAEPARWRTVVTDITIQERAAKAMVAARLAADTANRAKSHTLTAVSHDLRQPLQAITLLTGSLASTSRDPEQQAALAKVQEALRAIDEMLRSLVEAGRLTAGIVRPTVSPVSLQPLFDRLSAEFEPLARHRGLTLMVCPSQMVVLSDPQLLSRVLANLLANALNYATRGRVLLGGRRQAGQMKLQVWDTGPGIPEERRSEIFDEFVQLGNPARDGRKGFGLGLAICRSICNLLGHSIGVRSWPGRGSVFEVTVPLADPSLQSPAPPARPLTAGVPPIRPPTSQPLILLIEDQALVRDAIASILRAQRFEVLEVGSASAALDLLEQIRRKPDLILSDYRLDGAVNGADAINLLRDYCRQPVAGLLITGDASPEILGNADRRGLPLLHKPVEAVALVAAINEALANAAAGQPTNSQAKGRPPQMTQGTPARP